MRNIESPESGRKPLNGFTSGFPDQAELLAEGQHDQAESDGGRDQEGENALDERIHGRPIDLLLLYLDLLGERLIGLAITGHCFSFHSVETLSGESLHLGDRLSPNSYRLLTYVCL